MIEWMIEKDVFYDEIYRLWIFKPRSIQFRRSRLCVLAVNETEARQTIDKLFKGVNDHEKINA